MSSTGVLGAARLFEIIDRLVCKNGLCEFLVKFVLEKLKLGLKLRIVVCLLCSCCSIFKVLFIFILFRKVIVIIENAAIIE